nr:cytidine deaminase [Burkholderia glumae]
MASAGPGPDPRRPARGAGREQRGGLEPAAFERARSDGKGDGGGPPPGVRPPARLGCRRRAAARHRRAHPRRGGAPRDDTTRSGEEQTMDHDTLIETARRAREHAYAPYSRFQVGAAVTTHDGRVFAGCNVENGAYGLSNCAERTALFAAIAAGCRPGDFAVLAVIGDTPEPIAPCGACRQVMVELGGPALSVVLANLRGARQETTAAALLPGAFRL